MRVVDLSEAIKTGMNVYPGDPEVVVERTRSIEADGWEVRTLALGSHTGTHVDAFSHVTAGRSSIDDIPLDQAKKELAEDPIVVSPNLIIEETEDEISGEE